MEMEEEYIAIPASEYEHLKRCKEELVALHETKIVNLRNQMQSDAISSIVNSLNKDRDFNYLQIKELEALLSSLDTLEIKEVDLEKEITIYLGDNWKQDTPIEVQNDMISYAKHFFELGMQVSNKEQK